MDGRTRDNSFVKSNLCVWIHERKHRFYCSLFFSVLRKPLAVSYLINQSICERTSEWLDFIIWILPRRCQKSLLSASLSSLASFHFFMQECQVTPALLFWNCYCYQRKLDDRLICYYYYCHACCSHHCRYHLETKSGRRWKQTQSSHCFWRHCWPD